MVQNIYSGIIQRTKMVTNGENYSQLSDAELIERLTATPVDEKLHNYFFTKKCRQFLRYISSNIC